MQERIGLISDNSIGFVKALLTIWEQGKIAVVIDWRIPLSTLLEMLEINGVKECYSDFHHAKGLSENNYTVHNIDYQRSQTAEWLDAECYKKYDMLKTRYEDVPAIVFFSSGTTGIPKGIVLTHYAISSNASYTVNFFNINKSSSLCIIKALSHSSTLVCELIVALIAKSRACLFRNITAMESVARQLSTEQFTHISVNPTILWLLSSSALRRKIVQNSLRVIVISGSMLHSSVVQLAQQAFPNTLLCNAYGQTECGPRVSIKKIGKNETFVDGNVGRPFNNIQLKLIKSNKDEAENGEIGQIYIKTPTHMYGYISISTQQDTTNSWIATGDSGYIDSNGDLIILGRIDDLIISASHNIIPDKIENIIEKYSPDIHCIVFSTCDPLYGEKIICMYSATAYITPELHLLCKRHLAPYEIPHEFVQVSRIPTTINGKPSRAMAKKQYKKIKQGGQKYEST